MGLKLFTLVANENFSEDEVVGFFKNNYNLTVKDTVTLAKNAVQLKLSEYDDLKSEHVSEVLTERKVDFCIKDEDDMQFKVLLCDMDATMIANETLDDLVKITGSDFNVDETSKLAMEGKIDLRTTLKNRVEILKGHPKELIDEVLKGIKFNPGGKTLVRTLNSRGYISNLITGGFKPISSYVGEQLGFHNVISNEFCFDENDKFTGEYVAINGERNSKYRYMETLSKEKNLSFNEMLAVGDGSNDLEMLKHSGLGIGYHAHEIIREHIDTQIQFTDLTTILYFLGIKQENFLN
jgi:phosphoserine phosphatase